MEQVHLSCLPGFEGCELMASTWPLHMAVAHQMSPVDVITRVTVITKGMGFHGPEGFWLVGRQPPGRVGSVVNGSEEATGCGSSDVPWRAQSGCVEKNQTALPLHFL